MVERQWMPATLLPGLDEAGLAGRDGTAQGLCRRGFGYAIGPRQGTGGAAAAAGRASPSSRR